MMQKVFGNNKDKTANRILAGVLCAVLVFLTMFARGFAASSFSDVVSGHWAYNYVEYCYGQGIVEGVGNGKFDPDATLTRAQFITMMGRATYESEVQAQTTSSDSWYSGYVRYLSNKGYLDGIATDETSLNQGMPRQEMAQLLYNLCDNGEIVVGLYSSEYEGEVTVSGVSINVDMMDYISDANSIGSQYKDAVEYCYYVGLLMGFEDGSFQPNGTVTRAQACAVVNRADYWNNALNLRRSELKRVFITDDAIGQVVSNEIIRLINEYRVENGLEEYTVKKFMNQGAAVRAAEFAAYPSLAHTRPDGTSKGYVYKDLFGGSNLDCAENLTGVTMSNSKTLCDYAENIVQNWKDSSGHNKTLLYSSYIYIGCGVSFTSSAIYCSTNYTSEGQLKQSGPNNYSFENYD
ncbi:MAG: S-layer homology domain-containing protein [Oscillospiraceae bacterium]|nr:S-layer homology domain-containing protein [Oscillospiraceae bacterium]